MANETLKYFKHTQYYYRFVVLKKIASLGKISLPVESDDLELLHALSKVQPQHLIQDGLIQKIEQPDEGVDLMLTEKGKLVLKKHFIDFRLELLKLEATLEKFYSETTRKLKEKDIIKIALYGASDTAQSFSGYLLNHGFEIACILDDDINKQGKTFLGFNVIPPKEISKYEIDAVIITTVEYQDQILSNFSRLTDNQYTVIPLFD